ncbi:MAG TPA: GatB/YqeY domain-containing protein [Candidatus Paceibacterota bacterium]|nr:GatB/YqeY domain-containing protein [Candidatus Paceibacterota bacterium]
MLHEKIKEDIKEATKRREELRLGVLRGISAALINELVAKRRKPDELISDEDTLTVIARLAKQRKDSIEQFRAGGREDLAREEEAELVILQGFLPDQMSRAEVLEFAKKKKAALDINDKAKAGQLMGMIMKELKGKADGGMVKEVVESLFK